MNDLPLKTAPAREPGPIRNAARDNMAAIFQNRDEAEENHDLRQEHDDTADTLDDAVGQEGLRRSVGQMLTRQARQPFESRFYPIHKGLGGDEDRDEEQKHHGEEGERAPDAVGEEAVEPVGGGHRPGGRFFYRGGHDSRETQANRARPPAAGTGIPAAAKRPRRRNRSPPST